MYIVIFINTSKNIDTQARAQRWKFRPEIRHFHDILQL